MAPADVSPPVCDELAAAAATSLAIAGDVRDPYPDLADRLAQGPVQEVGPRRAGGDAPAGGTSLAGSRVFTVLGYAAARTVLRDPVTFPSAGYAAVLEPVMGRTLLQLDPPEHAGQRALVAAAFRPRVLAGLAVRLARRTVVELLAPIAERGSGELVHDLTFPYPVRVIARLLGLAEEDYPRFQTWSLALIGAGTDPAGGRRASVALAGYLEGVLATKRRHPGPDLLSRLLVAEVDGQRLSVEEITSFVRLLLPAGAETTYRSAGSLLFAVLTTPGLAERLRGDPGHIPAVIEEGLRWEPPVMFVARTAARDTHLAGVGVPAGSVVAISLGAANHDPARWCEPERLAPDRFDPDRDARGHLSFGDGPHACLGLQLARLEIRVLLEELVTRLPGLTLLPDGDPHVHGMVFRSPTHLPVLTQPRS